MSFDGAKWRYAVNEAEHEHLMNGTDKTPELGVDYLLDNKGDILVPIGFKVPEKQIAHSFPANEAVVTVLLEMVVGDDTRSDFRWLRLQNGDLILGVFPRGDGYFEVETEVEFDYKRAERDGNVQTILYDKDDDD